mgnify:CR=1 FL=1
MTKYGNADTNSEGILNEVIYIAIVFIVPKKIDPKRIPIGVFPPRAAAAIAMNPLPEVISRENQET